MGRLFQTALAEAGGGAVAAVLADSLLYAIDTAKVRAQASPRTSAQGGWRILFKGMIPTIALGSVPVFGSFFVLYAPLKVSLQERNLHYLLPIASVLCAVPATIIGVPADVLKKRLVLGIDSNARQAVSHILAEHGAKGFFAGWHINLVRDLPFAGVKIGLYEAFVRQWKVVNGISSDGPITTTGAATCGVASGVVCGIVTCPLDVINTRIKASTTQTTSIRTVGEQILVREGVQALFRGVLLRSLVLGIGSSIFWPIQHSVSNQLQPYDSCPVHSEEGFKIF